MPTHDPVEMSPAGRTLPALPGQIGPPSISLSPSILLSPLLLSTHLGFGYRTVALAGLRTLENLSALGMVHCIQQVLNKCYFFVLMVGSVRGKTGLLAIERTCGNTQWSPS